MRKIILGDKQDITRMGLLYVCREMNLEVEACVYHKIELARQLADCANSVVVLDYANFDILDTAELLLLADRFSSVHWIIFCDELSEEFVRMLMGSNEHFSFVLKDSMLSEIQEALRQALIHKRYVCQRTMENLLFHATNKEERVGLTKTEQEILKDIALGYTTKEIAEKRFSSFHTINTHRKNIFRKIKVNTIHEATKYALRAGMIDAAEYYI